MKVKDETIKVQVYIKDKDLISKIMQSKKRFDNANMMQSSMSQYLGHIIAKQLLGNETKDE